MLTQVAERLTQNGFEVVRVPNAEEAKKAVLALIPAGVEVGLGGSMSTRGLKLDEALRERGHEVVDHWLPGRSPEEQRQALRRQVAAPVYLTGLNAVTMDGKLVNIDNTGNRVAAMIFGPDHVIALAGKNKIVPDVPCAVARIKNQVTPLNTKRRKDKTPCAVDGKCHDCDSPDRLCRATCVLEKKTRGVGRFTVILVDEELGW